MKIAKRSAETKSLLPPCCLRIHPNDQTLVFLGTYKLEKETGERHGSIETLQIKDGAFTKLASVATVSAILDLKFNPQNASMLVSAHSTGEIAIWNYQEELKKISTLQISEDSNLVTSIFFDPLNSNKLLATLTSGESVIVDLTSGNVETMHTSHTLECWTGAFGEIGASQNVIFTGGDDAKLIAHDLRTMEKIWSTTHRHHDAGVVSILCPGVNWLNHRSSEIWTGSYDDNLRLFDLRKLDGEKGSYLYSGLLPAEKHKHNLNGGVWRLIPAPDSDDVLACCMYDGARVIKPTVDGLEVSRYFKGNHESMCYGGDWQSPDTIVTCSFYDNVVQAWSPKDFE